VIQENVDTWRTRQAVARYGKALRHPLCQAALSFWQTNAECLDSIKHFRAVEGVIKDAKGSKAKARALVERYRKARNSKEAKQDAANLHAIDNLLREAQSLNETLRKGILSLLELRAATEKRFVCESVAALRRGNFNAFNALERIWKRWISGDKESDHRALGVLELLRAKAGKAAWHKGGAAAGYTEAALGSDRVLSDVEWPQLTTRELHSFLVAHKEFLPPCHKYQLRDQMHEVRRLAKRLGIKLSPDRRGPKRKPKN
jgi:hypothetical protein